MIISPFEEDLLSDVKDAYENRQCDRKKIPR
jgi:hypothetical protein